MRISTVIFFILGLVLLIPVTAAINDYFPWEAAYKQGTAEYSGHSYARQLQSVKECTIDPEVVKNTAFQRGAGHFLSNVKINQGF